MPPRIYAGRFDPGFPGIGIRARTEADRHSFRHHDRSSAAPAVLAELGDDAVVSDLARRTVLEHEVRHFRDALLFPLGAAVIRSRIHATYNGFLVALEVKRRGEDANVIPVPLQRWLRMTEVERAVFLADESAFARKILRAPTLPIIPIDDSVSELASGPLSTATAEETLVLGCRLALADYQMIESLWRSPYAEGEELVAPALDVWEAAGLMCQLTAIEHYAGGPLMQRFIGWVAHHGPAPYRRGLSVLDYCLDRLGWAPHKRNYLALTVWAQMGAYLSERTTSSPADRLSAIVKAAKRGERWRDDVSSRDLFRSWDEITASDSIAALQNATTRFVAFCQRAVAGSAGMRTMLPVELFRALGDARERMLAAFLADCDAYIDPVAYLGAEDRYPLPCVGLEYPSESFGSEWEDVTPLGWSPAVGFDEAISLVAMASISDALFLPSERSLQENGRAALSRTLDLRAIRIIR